MINLLKRGVGTLLIFALTACQTIQMPQVFKPTAPPNLSEQQLADYSEDFNRTIMEGILLGAAGGAALGAVASASADGKDFGISILVGGLIGAAVGGLGGYYVAKKKGEYSSKYALLDSMKEDVQTENTKLKTYVQLARKVRLENEARMARLRNDHLKGTLDTAAYKEQLARVDANHREIGGALDDLKSRESEFLQASQDFVLDYPDTNTHKFDQQILEYPS